MRSSDCSSDVCSSDLKGLIPGLSLTADWFDIKIKDAIRAIPGSTKLAICYASQNLSHPFCDDFTRSALTGEVTFLSAQPINTGRAEMNGLDPGLVSQNNIGSVTASPASN